MISKVLEGWQRRRTFGNGCGLYSDIRNERDAVYIGMIIEQRIIDYTEERLI